MRRAAALAGICAALIAAPAAARDSLGVFDDWGAFRDPDAPRCYAISQPVREMEGEWEPFASVGYWPRRGVSGQVHFRLRRAMREEGGAALVIGDRRFELVGRGPDAWAEDRAADAEIVAAMRAGRSMRVEARSARGRFSDSYDLSGAATAIDAAALGCAG